MTPINLGLVLVEDGILFSGDHILNGSTTVVDPPDGNMNAYLDSLDRLSSACDEHGINFIVPAHGYVIGEAKITIAQLKAHRLKREVKILAVMQAQPAGSMDDWVALAYDDVDRASGRWPSVHCGLMWSASTQICRFKSLFSTFNSRRWARSED